jgi:CO/xanthine dehydrogenase FAD-binding subunit
MAVIIRHRTLVSPRTLKEALQRRHDDPDVMPMAGCTDLYVSLNFGSLTSTRFLNLWRLDALRGIDVRERVVRIGALTTYTELIRSPIVKRHLPMLVAASREIGGVQIQHRGTIGGNVANASPAGDTLPVLAVAQAVVELQSVRGARLVPFTEFYTGYRQSAAAPDELIVALHVPRPQGHQWFRKVGTRAAQAISKIVMAGVGGDEPRLALGSVAPTVVRLPKTEALLARGGSLAQAQAQLQDEIAPIDDVRSTAAYRRQVAANLLGEFWRTAGPGPSRARR